MEQHPKRGEGQGGRGGRERERKGGEEGIKREEEGGGGRLRTYC